MAKTTYKSVSEYIGKQPKGVQPILTLVRSTIRKALPRAEEGISYQIPVFKQDGRAVIYFAAWKQHFSVYPATGSVAVVLKEALKPYEVSKGTIRFPLSEPVPVNLIARIAKLRAKDAAESAAAPRKIASRKSGAVARGARAARRFMRRKVP